MTLDLRASNDCSALRGVHIGVAGAPVAAEERVGAFLTAEAPRCKPGALEIGTLVVTPGESGRAAVIVVAGVSSEAKDCARPDYKGCVVARRSLSFVEGSPLVVPILIDFSCEDVPCDVDTTCRNGQCIGAALDCTEEGCVFRDPRGRDDEDGGTLVDGADDRSADRAEVADVGPSDGPPVSDAPSDGAVVGQCPHPCPYGGAPGGPAPCATGQACCYSKIGAPSCKLPDDCLVGAGSQPPGVAACCRGTTECGAKGPYCCVDVESTSPFSGVATCRPTPCGAAEVQLCTQASDCASMMCVQCNTLSAGYDDPTLTCCMQ